MFNNKVDTKNCKLTVLRCVPLDDVVDGLDELGREVSVLSFIFSDSGTRKLP